MRRRKPATIQINVRLDAELVRDLEMRAKANRTNLSAEIRTRVIDSLKAESLADFRAAWLRRLRDAIETIARQEGGNIEEVWGVLSGVDAGFSMFYGDTETKLSKYVRYTNVRALLRGTPAVLALPDETQAKSTRQE